MRLTDIALQKLPFTDRGQKRIRDETLPGFGVLVGTRTKTFFVMYGPRRQMKTLGKYPHTSLREARREAVAVLDAPPPKKRVVGKNELLTAFLEHCEATLRPSTIRRYRHSLTKPEPESSHDVAAFKAMYNWGLRSGLVDQNPYQHRQATYKQRDRVLSDEEVSSLWKHERKPFSDIVKLLILTGQRRGQFQAFQPSWIQGEEIHFPPAVMKSRRPHAIPLTPLAHSFIEQLTPFNGWGKSKARLDVESGVTDWVLHDLRRTFSTTMARLGVPLHICERLLDHSSGSFSGVVAVYNRYSYLSEMRDALKVYENHLSSIVAQGII